MSASCSCVQTNGIPNCYYSTDADQDLYMFGHGFDHKARLSCTLTVVVC